MWFGVLGFWFFLQSLVHIRNFAGHFLAQICRTKNIPGCCLGVFLIKPERSQSSSLFPARVPITTTLERIWMEGKKLGFKQRNSGLLGLCVGNCFYPMLGWECLLFWGSHCCSPSPTLELCQELCCRSLTLGVFFPGNYNQIYSCIFSMFSSLLSRRRDQEGIGHNEGRSLCWGWA